jgi:diguanylate cyclase (GGDEF)-like protein
MSKFNVTEQQCSKQALLEDNRRLAKWAAELERRIEEVRLLSDQDPLTNLYNRRYMQEALEQELQLATQSCYSVGVVILDLDHFKRFNDTFGHDAGDALLCAAGEVLKSRIRSKDIACRFGGEEFVVILPETSLAEATCLAKDLRLSIGNLKIKHRCQPLGSITASMGVAVFPANGATVDTVLRAADSALYRAKVCGRDRIEVSHAETSEGVNF